MNPETGRFTQMDTWSGSLSKPVTLNKYLYADGNPEMGVDPSGNMTIMEAMTVVAVVGIMASCAEPGYSSTGCTCNGKKWGNKELFDTEEEVLKKLEQLTFDKTPYPNLNYEYGSQISKHKKSGCGKECFYFVKLENGLQQGNGYNRVYLGPRSNSNVFSWWYNHPDNSTNVFSDKNGDGDIPYTITYGYKSAHLSVRADAFVVQRNTYYR